MQRHIGWWLLAGVLAAMPAAAQSVNPKAVAQLRWYPVNQSATYTTPGNGALALGFDGENIWVSSDDDNVYKLRPSDGKILGNYSVQNGSRGMAFDGENMWVSNYNSFSVSKIRASDGTNLGNFRVGEYPIAVFFNGTNIVVVNSNAIVNGVVVILRPADGTILNTSASGTAASGAAFDGTYVWITIEGGLVTFDGNGVSGPSLTTPAQPLFAVFDGKFMWVSLANQTVIKIARNGTSSNALSIVGTYSVPNALQLGFDGQAIWVLGGNGNGGITKLRASDGENLGTFPSTKTAQGGNQVVFDGANMWIGCQSTTDNNIQTICKN